MRHLLAGLMAAFGFVVVLGSASAQPYAAPSFNLDESAEEAEELACCKTCRKGKACGDSCISRQKQCHKGPGCACDG